MATGNPSWNEIPFDPDATPEEKAQEFDLQIAENTESAETKRENREYPYDQDTPERRKP